MSGIFYCHQALVKKMLLQFLNFFGLAGSITPETFKNT